MALSEAQTAEITAIVTENIVRYKAEATAEQKAAALAQMEERKDPAKKQEQMAKLQEGFAAVDSDNDGRISQAEFI